MTISGNSASVTGSAIYETNFGGLPATIALTNCTVADNSGGAAVFVADNGGAATVTLKNAIFANNGGTTFGSEGASAQIISQGDNLDSGNGEGFLTAAGDLINTDPRLLPLDNYGGRTPTYLPQLSSPAVNAGASNGAPAIDQRGVPRPQSGAVDIGAVELRPLIVYSANDAGDGFCDGTCTLRDAITQANNDDAVADDIFLSSAVFGTPQTINLASALPNIAGDITITRPWREPACHPRERRRQLHHPPD